MKTQLKITGMHCASCALTTEQALKKVPGVTEARVNYASERATVEHEEHVQSEALVEAVRDNGYGSIVEKRGSVHADHAAMGHEKMNHGEESGASHLTHGGYIDTKGLVIAGVLAVPLIVSMFVMLPTNLLAFCAWVLVAVLGWKFHTGTWNDLRHVRASMDTLVTVGTGSALLWSTYAFVIGSGDVYF
ncbi:cation transporter, partial [Candidatus Uhrbacteria bacterium]|nr:cation transporter [Candidatus Uhrbacteria bacterium]